jgi:hypothetical protein
MVRILPRHLDLDVWYTWCSGILFRIMILDCSYSIYIKFLLIECPYIVYLPLKKSLKRGGGTPYRAG